MQMYKHMMINDVVSASIEHELYQKAHDWDNKGSECVFVLQGTAIYSVDKQQFAIKKGDVFAIYGSYSKSISRPQDLQLCSLFYNESEIHSHQGFSPAYEAYQTLFMRQAHRRLYADKSLINIGETQLEKVNYLLNLMEQECQNPTEGSEQLLNSWFYIILTWLLRSQAVLGPGKFDEDIPFYAAIDFMQRNYTKDISLQQIAAIAQITPRHFDRMFKQQFQSTPKHYLLNLRINRARSLLVETDLPIAEIAAQCGFANSKHFADCFRSFRHMSATEYRRKYIVNYLFNMSDFKKFSQ